MSLDPTVCIDFQCEMDNRGMCILWLRLLNPTKYENVLLLQLSDGLEQNSKLSELLILVYFYFLDVYYSYYGML